MNENEQYLRAVLDAFQQKVLEYYATNSTGTSEIERVSMVKNSLRNLSFEGFTIGSDNYGCPIETECIGGVCVPITGAPAFEWSDRDGVVPRLVSTDNQ